MLTETQHPVGTQLENRKWTHFKFLFRYLIKNITLSQKNNITHYYDFWGKLVKIYMLLIRNGEKIPFLPKLLMLAILVNTL